MIDSGSELETKLKSYHELALKLLLAVVQAMRLTCEPVLAATLAAPDLRLPLHGNGFSAV